MVMPSSGALNMGGTTSPVSVAAELGLGLTSTITMNDAAVRALAGVGGSGTSWSMSSLYGKSNRVAVSATYASNTTNASLNVAAIGGYVAGRTDVTITVNSGVWIRSTSTGTPALTLTGGTSGDTVTLVNNGFIAGRGGNGGVGVGAVGSAGGIAISLGFNTTINNTNGSAYIGGGGGGGGNGSSAQAGSVTGGASGGGAGGGHNGNGSGGSITPGAAGNNGSSTANVTAAGGGGAGGGGGGYYTTGGKTPASEATTGGGGGWIFPGSGGAGAVGSYCRGGNGGAANAVGGNTSINVAFGGGGGGGWGAAGGSANVGGGAGGRAVALNGRTVTWVSGNTTRVYGGVS